MHPLRAALRLHASPSLGEGEVFPLRLDVQGGINAGLGRWCCFVHPLRAALCLHASPSLGEGEVFPPLSPHHFVPSLTDPTLCSVPHVLPDTLTLALSHAGRGETHPIPTQQTTTTFREIGW